MAPSGRPMPAMCAGWSPPSTSRRLDLALREAIHLHDLVDEEADLLLAGVHEQDARPAIQRRFGEPEAAPQVDDRHEPARARS